MQQKQGVQEMSEHLPPLDYFFINQYLVAKEKVKEQKKIILKIIDRERKNRDISDNLINERKLNFHISL